MDNQNNMVNQTTNVEPTVVPTTEPTVTPTIDPNVVPQSQPTAQFTPNEPAQTKSKKGLIIACIAVLVLIGAGIGVYFGFFRKVSGKQVVNGTINKIFESAIKAADKVEKNVVIDYKNDIVKTNGSVRASITTDDTELQQQLNNLSSVALDYDLRLDLKTLSGSLDLTEKENDKAIITLNTLVKDKVLYFKTDKTNGVYKYDLSKDIDWDAIDVSKLPEYKSNSLTSVLKKIQGYVKDSIKEEYITQEEGEYTVDGETIKGLKTTITLTEERTKEIEKSVIDSLMNDEDGLKLFAEFLMMDKQEVKASLEKAKDSMDQPTTDKKIQRIENKKNEEVKINIYTTKQGKFLGFDTLDEDGKNGVTAVAQGDLVTIKFLTDGKVSLKLTYNEKEKELVWKNEEEGNKNETIVVKFSENGFKVTFSMDGLNATLEFNETITNDSVSMNFNVGFDYSQDGKKLGAKVEFNNSLSKVTEINEFSTAGSKDVNTLTEAEQEQFGNEIKSALEKSVIFSVAMKSVEEQNKANTAVNTNSYYSSYCSVAYDCKNYGGDYNYCKYKYDGYEYSVLCPIN